MILTDPFNKRRKKCRDLKVWAVLGVEGTPLWPEDKQCREWEEEQREHFRKGLWLL